MKKLLCFSLIIFTTLLTGCLDDSDVILEITESELNELLNKRLDKENIVATYTRSVVQEYQESIDSEYIYIEDNEEYTYIFNDDRCMIITETNTYKSTEIYDYETDTLYSMDDDSGEYTEVSIDSTGFCTTYEQLYYTKVRASFLSNFLLDEFITSYEDDSYYQYVENCEIYKTINLDLVYVCTQVSRNSFESFYKYSQVATYTYTYSFTDSEIEIPK